MGDGGADSRCVRCRADVAFEAREKDLACPACGTTYPLYDGCIPVLVDDAAAAANWYGRMFREDAVRYDAQYRVEREHGQWVLGRIVELEPEIRRLSGGVFLEIGAGTGPLTRALASGSPFSFRRLDVTDLSPEMLAVNLRQREDYEASSPIRYRACNVRNLPVPDGSIDLVIGMDVLHHILDTPRALAEIRRVLRPGGVCVVKEPHRGAYHMLGFLSRILLRMDRRWLPFSGLRRDDRKQIAAWQAHIFRLMDLADRGEHEKLADLDDKYFFDPQRLANEARQAGFSRFSECNVLWRPGEKIPYAPMILDTFRGLGVSERGLAFISRLADDLDATLGPHLLRTAPINTLFLFWKGDHR